LSRSTVRRCNLFVVASNHDFQSFKFSAGHALHNIRCFLERARTADEMTQEGLFLRGEVDRLVKLIRLRPYDPRMVVSFEVTPGRGSVNSLARFPMRTTVPPESQRSYAIPTVAAFPTASKTQLARRPPVSPAMTCAG
jgi:hypothetical protein